MYRIPCLLVFLIFFIACNSSNENNTSKTPGQQVVAPTADNWYKRYTGTIAGQPVVLLLHAQQGFSGYYFYRNKSRIFFLSGKTEDPGEVTLSESQADVDEREEEVDEAHPKWVVTFDGNKLNGKWHSADGNKVYDIVLQEDYSGACSFTIVTSKDSARVKIGKHEYGMEIERTLLMPSGKMNQEDSAFVERAILHQLGADSMGAVSFAEYVRINNELALREYKVAMKDMADPDDTEERATNNWEYSEYTHCVYDDHGIMVYETGVTGYTGGAHGYSAVNYLCLDIKQKKVLQLSDILNVDTFQLNSMLEQKVRSLFKFGSGEKLGERLLVDTIPPTDNFIFSDAGLSFYYNQYEIASYADGPVTLFLSYTQLKDMLKPGFKKRLKLE